MKNSNTTEDTSVNVENKEPVGDVPSTDFWSEAPQFVASTADISTKQEDLSFPPGFPLPLYICCSHNITNIGAITCKLARLVWRVVHFTFNILAPANITNLFGNWLNGVPKKTKAHIRIGVCAILWAIWNCRNDVVFNKSVNTNFLQVLHRVAYWINMWSFLLPVDQRGSMDTGCTRLMAVVRAIYNQGGWQLSNRLKDA